MHSSRSRALTILSAVAAAALLASCSEGSAGGAGNGSDTGKNAETTEVLTVEKGGPCEILGPVELYEGGEVPTREGDSLTWDNDDTITVRHCVPIIGPKSNGTSSTGVEVSRYALLDPDFAYDGRLADGPDYIRIFYLDYTDSNEDAPSLDLDRLAADPGLSENNDGEPNKHLVQYLSTVGVEVSDQAFRTWSAPEAVVVYRTDGQDIALLINGDCQAAGQAYNLEIEDFSTYTQGNYRKECFPLGDITDFKVTDETLRARLGENGLRFLKAEARSAGNDIVVFQQFWAEQEYY